MSSNALLYQTMTKFTVLSVKSSEEHADEAIRRNQLVDDFQFVVDGGELLHRVRWAKGASFDEICVVYSEHINWHYPNVMSFLMAIRGLVRSLTSVNEEQEVAKNVQMLMVFSCAFLSRLVSF